MSDTFEAEAPTVDSAVEADHSSPASDNLQTDTSSAAHESWSSLERDLREWQASTGRQQPESSAPSHGTQPQAREPLTPPDVSTLPLDPNFAALQQVARWSDHVEQRFALLEQHRMHQQNLADEKAVFDHGAKIAEKEGLENASERARGGMIVAGRRRFGAAAV